MNIEVRWIGNKYREVRFWDLHSSIETSTLDEEESKALAAELMEAAEELLREPW